ncbi:hypothetical protein H6G00_01365 [Leptolyngbya sp. FACHB-541]|uniref:hypothetical protein n=1 Tax=Leptolyngbya sp. FACHB-541 TaxID=2692810 RepID=UPI0016827F0E|nr:hypothetical protein [Leptolyngbya sp. FACHB-541]MBD1995278.1 hypothetical protein [Leptolyngbya sp. FACHB-541]
MLNLYLAVDDAECQYPEWLSISQSDQPMQPNGKVSLGSNRVWSILDVDQFELEDQTHPERESPEIISVGHCDLNPNEAPPREKWFNIENFQERPLTSLQVFVNEQGSYISDNWNFTGKRPKLGKLLPQYNVDDHTVTSQPWGTVAIDFYRPQERPNMFVNGIYIVHCIYVPEALRELATA